jgi:hypothetical protein
MRPGRDQAMMLSRQATPHSVTVVQNEGEQEEEQEEQEARDKEEEDKHGGVRSGGRGRRSQVGVRRHRRRGPEAAEPRPQTSATDLSRSSNDYYRTVPCYTVL